MSQYDDRSDGIAQLTELMRFEPERIRVDDPPPVDPAKRRRRRRLTAIVAGAVALVIAGSATGYSAWALNAPVGAATIDAEAPDVVIPDAAQVVLSPDGLTAISVDGADEYLGQEASGIWMIGGGNDTRPMASISKIITALVILDAKPLPAGEAGPTITFDAADYKLYDKYYVLGATIAAMPTGSSMSLHDALEMMLVISASNYAEAVSTWAFGSQSAFLRAARGWLAANGMANTTIVEPTGIDPRNTSTPSDLVLLGKLAMANPVVAEIVGMPQLDVPGVPSQLNTNVLLGTDGIVGIKTGTLEDTGSNLLFQANFPVGTEQPIRLTGVILGGFSRDSVNLDVRALIASIQAGFHRVPLGTAGQQIGAYETAWGESAAIVLSQDADILTWSDTPIEASFTVEPLTTGTAGDEVGEVTWTAGPNTVTVALELADDIDPPDSWWRLTHPGLLGD